MIVSFCLKNALLYCIYNYTCTSLPKSQCITYQSIHLWLILRLHYVPSGPGSPVCLKRSEPLNFFDHNMFLCFQDLLRLVKFLAHLSRRLTGELIVYPCSGVRRRPSSSVVRRPSFTISKIFSSETTWPIKAKLRVEHP